MAHQLTTPETVESSGKGTAALINEILDFSKMATDCPEIERISFSATELVERLLQPCTRRAAVKKILLTCRTSPDFPELVRGNPRRLAQILTNLIVNAIRATDAGEVLVSIRVEEKSSEDVMLRFEVLASLTVRL